jgi:hypothetical protein
LAAVLAAGLFAAGFFAAGFLAAGFSWWLTGSTPVGLRSTVRF